MSNPTQVAPIDMNRNEQLAEARTWGTDDIDAEAAAGGILGVSTWCADKFGVADTATWQFFQGIVKYSVFGEVMNKAFYSGENTNYLLVFSALLFLFELVGNLWLALSTGSPDSVHSSDGPKVHKARAEMDVRTALCLKTPCACFVLMDKCKCCGPDADFEWPKAFGKTIKCFGPIQTSIKSRPRYFGLWTTLSLIANFIAALLMVFDGFIYGDILFGLLGVGFLFKDLYSMYRTLSKKEKNVAPVFCYPFCRKRDQFKETNGWKVCPFTGNNLDKQRLGVSQQTMIIYA